MTTRAGNTLRRLIVALAGTTILISATGTSTATAAPLDYGNGCTLYPDNRAATVDSLRFRCSPQQQDAIYLAASPGAVTRGVKNGWVTRPPSIAAVAPAVWIGKTFYTGADGGYLDNRLTAGGVEAYRADVYRGPSIMDGKPAWALNYAPSPTPPLYDEVREVTPGVWFGHSWWRGGQNTQLLAFVLT